jgi:hypothetical protein
VRNLILNALHQDAQRWSVEALRRKYANSVPSERPLGRHEQVSSLQLAFPSATFQ